VVTPEGLPLADEVLPGNTAAKTTLRGFLERIERQYGKARRVWLDGPRRADRGGARLDRNKLRQTRLREGRYRLRTNLVERGSAMSPSWVPVTAVPCRPCCGSNSTACGADSCWLWN